MKAILAGAIALAALLTPTLAGAGQAADAPSLETGLAALKPVHAAHEMVVTENPLATKAGLDVLKNGGTAADALVAVQTVLGLVEPQSSGLGGGAFLVWYDADTGQVTTFDGRETAPDAATPSLFLDGNRKPLDFMTAVVGGRAVGVPGVPRLIEKVQGLYGKLQWSDLIQPAISLAQKGFAVSPRLAAEIAEDKDRLASQPSTRAYFFRADGTPLQAGDILKNPAYADTLTSIAYGGADEFYVGPIAGEIVKAVRGHPTNPGSLSQDDLADYQVKQRAPVCQPYRGYDVCGMGPPSSGALTIGQILGIASNFDLAGLGPDDPQSWRIIGDATRLAFADRNRYMADTDFVDMPEGLLSPAYLDARAKLVKRQDALPQDAVKAGSPPWEKAELRLTGISPEMPSTTHFVIVDKWGNVASMTSSIEGPFGAHLMAGGFLLNNELTDFSFLPDRNGEAVANRVEPGKRPRSSMSPTIVLKDRKPVMAIGSPGGSYIISYVANALIRMIDWKMNISQAVAAPHLIDRTGTYDLEKGTAAEKMAPDLEALGYKTKIEDMNSGLTGVTISTGGIDGAADPRREGVAAGD